MTPTATQTDRLFVSVRLTDHGHLVDTIDMLGYGRAMGWAYYVKDHLDVTVRDVGNDTVLATRINGTWERHYG
jgi:hypothetical protein